MTVGLSLKTDDMTAGMEDMNHTHGTQVGLASQRSLQDRGLLQIFQMVHGRGSDIDQVGAVHNNHPVHEGWKEGDREGLGTTDGEIVGELGEEIQDGDLNTSIVKSREIVSRYSEKKKINTLQEEILNALRGDICPQIPKREVNGVSGENCAERKPEWECDISACVILLTTTTSSTTTTILKF